MKTNTTDKTTPSCHRCGTELRSDGYCIDVTCPHSDWPQDVDISRMDGGDPAYASENQCKRRIEVQAVCYSDDHQQRIEFDAAPYFHEQLINGRLEKVIQSLIDIEFGGDYDSDNVCEFFSASQTKPLFDYLEVVNRGRPQFDGVVGFECHVDEVDVKQWLRSFSPETLSLF
ncbi:hypothetical protein ACS91_21985 [Vibrio parahaemolyticus]|uniref:hypothetical protein n=1 Tax=Vibrio parahaemolyticus TaxID=670 RepID=UPI0006A5F200|nr:hypothetical protein ACS91_21985 [Vibrio parahaemolyticus]